MNRSLLTTRKVALSLLLLALVILVPPAAATSAGPYPQPAADPATGAATGDAFEAFAAELEQIRQALRLPGMSAAIVRDQEVVWAQGFGYANVEQGVPATPETPYHLASVTKPIAATLLLQLVEEGRLSLEDPVSDYGIHLPETGVTVWHLLTHTSAGTPGARHNYDGTRYALLGRAIAEACGAPFGQCLADHLLLPLGMETTAANPAWADAGWAGTFAAMGWGERYGHFPQVYGNLARPYQFDAEYANVPGSYPLHFSPAAGLMASVTDIARFDIALDQDRLLPPARKAQMFTPAVANDGHPLIYGLGWYTQRYDGTRLIWHSGGWSPSVSALYVKVPDEGLTFILLANHYNLTRPYPLGDGDVLYSTPALAFYKHFVFPRTHAAPVPDLDWSAGAGDLVATLKQVADPDTRALLERELWSYRQLYASVGDVERVARLASVHRIAFHDSARSRLDGTATGTAGAPTAPLPAALLPEQITDLSLLLLVWLLLAAAALLALLFDFWRRRAQGQGADPAWILIVLLFGLPGLVAYRLAAGRPDLSASPWRQALGPVLYAATGAAAGLQLALLVIARYSPTMKNGALPAIGVMFLVNWLCFQAPLAATGRRRAPLAALWETFASTIITTVFILLGMLPAMIFLAEGVFMQVTPDSPLSLIILVLTALAGAASLYPYRVWRLRQAGSEASHARTREDDATELERRKGTATGSGLARPGIRPLAQGKPRSLTEQH